MPGMRNVDAPSLELVRLMSKRHWERRILQRTIKAFARSGRSADQGELE